MHIAYCTRTDATYSGASQIDGTPVLTLNTVVCVNSVEVTRDRNIGSDQSQNYTPEAVRTYEIHTETFTCYPFFAEKF
jgi:hypothetical protein